MEPTRQQVYPLRDVLPGPLSAISDEPEGRSVLGLPSRPGKSYFFASDAFSTSPDLWETDGTPHGTRKVKELGSACVAVYRSQTTCFPLRLSAAGDRLYFAHYSTATGVELWASDGTSTGTRLVKDIAPGTAPSVFVYGENHGLRDGSWVEIDGELYFTAEDGTHGPSLWKSAGTASGTVLVKDLDATCSDTVTIRELTRMGSELFFVTCDDGIGPVTANIWRSDGTGPGTVVVGTIETGFVSQLAAAGERLFLAVREPDQTSSLWTMATGGFELLRSFDGGLRELAAHNDALYLAANEQLWISDGSASGTKLLHKVLPGSFHSSDEALYFRGVITEQLGDGSVRDIDGLWRTDGTPEGTVAVATGFFPFQIVSTPGQIYFLADFPGRGIEIGASSGQPGTPVTVVETLPGQESVGPQELQLVGDRLYFWATHHENPYGGELWTLPLEPSCPEDVVIDNGMPGTRFTGTWNASSAVGSFGQGSVWAKATITSRPAYTFEAVLPAGRYEIFEWHTRFSTRTRMASFLIPFSGGTRALTIDQSVGGEQWNSLGTYPLAGSGTVTIRADDPVKSTNADAIRFACQGMDPPRASIQSITPSAVLSGQQLCFVGSVVSVLPIVAQEWSSSRQPTALLSSQRTFCRSDLVPGRHAIVFRARDSSGTWSKPVASTVDVGCSAETIIDNRGPGVTATKGWQISAAPGSYAGDSLWAKPAAGTGGIRFTFEATLPEGDYEVQEWHSSWSTRSQKVEHVIQGTATTSVIVDQSVHGGRWNLLGRFHFDGKSTVAIVATDTARSTNADAVRFVCSQ